MEYLKKMEHPKFVIKQDKKRASLSTIDVRSHNNSRFEGGDDQPNPS